MTLPLVTVVIVTYDRPEEIRRTINGLCDNIVYPRNCLRWHLADDSSPGSYIEDIKRDFPGIQFGVTDGGRGGWGVNVNKALKSIGTDYVYLNEDDYVPKKSINLQDGVLLMEAVGTIGLVRYDGVSGHRLTLILSEAKVGEDKHRLDFMYIHKNLSKDLNVYSNRPHLKHRRFHEAYGFYTEGLQLADTEVDFAHRVRDAHDGPAIAVLADGVPCAFDHIGKSRQGSEYDQPS